VTEEYDIQIVSRLRHGASLETVDFVSLRADAHASPKVGSVLSYDISNCNGVWHRDGASCVVFLPFEVLAKFQPDGEEPQDLATIRVAVRLQYEIRPAGDDGDDQDAKEVPDDDVKTFLAVSGFMHAWPYVRAEVQSLSAKIGLPAIVLPLMVTGHASRYVRLKKLEDVREEDIVDD
jgi:hypothetical protein